MMSILDHLTQLDAFLIVGCMALGAAGANIGTILLSDDLSDPDRIVRAVSWKFSRLMWSLGRLGVGATYGLAISLFTARYFTSHVHEVFQVFGFTLASSAFAPKIWLAQENRFVKVIDDRIDKYSKQNS